MKISRRKFIVGTFGAATLLAFPNISNGGDKTLTADYMIQGVKLFTPQGRVEAADIYVGGDKIIEIHWHAE